MLLKKIIGRKRRNISAVRKSALLPIVIGAVSIGGPGCVAPPAAQRPAAETHPSERAASQVPARNEPSDGLGDRHKTEASPSDQAMQDGPVSSNAPSHASSAHKDQDATSELPESAPGRSSDRAAAHGQARAYPDLGIELLSVRLTAANYLIDLRYRVLDAEKAATWMEREHKPYLIDEASGARFFTPSPPKVGPLRQTSRAPHAGRSYFIMFANPDGFVKRGAEITVVVGEAKLEHLTLE